MSKQRMDVVFSLIPQGEIIADVGCDHGILVNKLAQSNKCKLILASEISEKSLQKAKNNFRGGLVPVKFIFSNGLDAFDKNEYPDCVVIAGMGGLEIIDILSRCDLSKIKTLIIQPMRDQFKVREFISKHFKIKNDFIKYIKDKFYTFMYCESGTDLLSNEELYLGKTSFYDAPLDFEKYLDYNITKYKEYSNAANKPIDEIDKKIVFLQKVKEKYYGKNIRISKN